MNPLTKGQNVHCFWKCPHIINVTIVIYRIYEGAFMGIGR